MALLGQGFEDPRSAAIMALAGGLLKGDFGGGLLGANQAYAQSQDGALKRQLAQAQLEESQAQTMQRRALAQKETEALARAARQQQALPGLFRQPGMTGGEAVPQEAGGVPMFSQPMGAAPMRQTPGGFDVQGAIAAGFSPEQITAYAGLQNIGRPKVARTVKGMGPDGREFEYQVDEFGQKVGDGMAQYRAPLSVNQGDRTTFADPYSLKPMGQFQTNQSPDSKASNAIAIRGQDMVDARSREANMSGKAPAGYRWGPDGTSLVAIPGGPADKQTQATEGERKAATLLKRLEGSQQQLTQALTGDGGSESAAKPELLSEAIRGASVFGMGIPGREAMANAATSQQRQRVEAAQLDMLDAALTLGTGAAYTREQLEGYRKSYFPQIGDDEKTVEDKQVRLRNVIDAAKIAAGRAGGQVSAPPTAPPAAPNIPPGVTPLKWNPATRSFN